MNNKRAVSAAYLIVIFLSIFLSVGTVYLFSQLIDYNLSEDVSKSLPFSLYFDSISVRGVSDTRIDKHKDVFIFKGTLDQGGYNVDYQDMAIRVMSSDGESTYEYGDTLNASTFTIESILKSRNDTILRPNDKVHFTLLSPTTFYGGESVRVLVEEKETDSQVKIHFKINNDLYGDYMVLR